MGVECGCWGLIFCFIYYKWVRCWEGIGGGCERVFGSAQKLRLTSTVAMVFRTKLVFLRVDQKAKNAESGSFTTSFTILGGFLGDGEEGVWVLLEGKYC